MALFGNSMNLDIRPLEDNQKFEAFTVLEDNVRIVSFEPHMHAAGVRMCMDAIWGRTTQIETLSCVGYDHSWVRTYNFADHAAPAPAEGHHPPHDRLLQQYAHEPERDRPPQLVRPRAPVDRTT